MCDVIQEDLKFRSEFTLAARRNDYVQALVAYFDCSFTQVRPISSTWRRIWIRRRQD